MLLSDLSIGYRHHTVMSGINAELVPGELTCLIGRNGAGKSTLMRTMAAFQPPISGTITIPTKSTTSAEGETTAESTPSPDNGDAQPNGMLSQERTERGVKTIEAVGEATTRSRLISVVLTDRPDVPNMTIRDMVAMGRAPYTGFFGTLSKQDNLIIDEAMHLVGLFPSTASPVAGGVSASQTPASQSRLTPTTPINTLSDGERQKVMIAKALAQQTPYIFLDEPTAFLDYPTKIEVMKTLQRLCHEQHKAILLSTHDLDIALRHCDRVWHMHHGTLTICQPSPTLLENI